MKKLFNYIGDKIGTLLLFFLIVGMFEPPKKVKRFKWRYVLIFIALLFLGWQIVTTKKDLEYNDCVPATLQRVFPTYSLQELRSLCQTITAGTALSNVFSSWEYLSTNALEVHYSAAADYVAITNSAVRFDIPYLWIGIYQSNGHCALIRFTPTNVLFSHSQFYEGTTNYYVTDMNYYDFFDRTLLILHANEINESIRFY